METSAQPTSSLSLKAENSFSESVLSCRTIASDSEMLTCAVCQQRLARHKFSKKTIQNASYICTVCRKAATAIRCKQGKSRETQHIEEGRKHPQSGMRRRPNNWGYSNYVDQVFSMNCFIDLVQLRAFSSVKDISESMAALQAAKNYYCQTTSCDKEKAGSNHTELQSKKKQIKRTICLCIGDGSTPRTAVLAAFLLHSKIDHNWDSIVSIDPMLQFDWVGLEPNGVRGVTGFQGTLQNFLEARQTQCNDESQESNRWDHLVILLVHSHARFYRSL